ncbi:hypothetical protein IU450_38885 [Nocardia abscessus]|uniref:hypothetical protein n=1 Tax=Nocardia abscessus TaxID=120957 RepID=UPI0018931A93|nr:hypothetical protein [Nocardia abscessus]MBF6341804.1 hypothetical protein [Nocardia abscessus]
MSKKKNAAVAPETAEPAPERGSRSGVVPVLSRDSDSALWAALRAHPDSTTAALADIAGIGLSTARRLLAQWETAGCAQSHTNLESPRAAKTWTQGAGAPAAIEPDPAPAAPADPGPAEPAVPEPAATAPAEPATPESIAVEPTAPEPATPTEQATPADPAPVTAPETAVAAPTGDDPATPAPVPPAADDGVAAEPESTVERLPAGALRGQVEDHLRENPGKEFTPHQIGKALARSSGAVHNALVTLTKHGTARQTSAAPKKFTLAS